MKKLILFTLLTINLISCSKGCEKNCQGIDKKSTEYKYSPVLTEQKELIFKSEDSGEEFKMNLRLFKSTEPYIEESCGGYAKTSACRTTHKVIYDYKYKNTASAFYSNLYFYYKDNTPPSQSISFKNDKYDASITYTKGEFAISSPEWKKPLQKYTTELNNEVLTITNESENYSSETIKKIWIRKNKGIIKIELDDKIWIKQ